MSITAEPKLMQGLIDLNQSCYCFPIERAQIDKTITGMSQNPDMPNLLAERKNYFASTAVFVSNDDRAAIQSQITAIENTIKSTSYQQAIAARGDNLANSVQMETKGAFMGYDFHMTPDGPRLIEINTNAGGAFIVNALDRAIGKIGQKTEDLIGQMFIKEWQASGRSGRPKTIAIVDELPQEQFHYPDMCLAADSLRQQGFDVVIAGPEQLDFDGTTLRFEDAVIDVVYNRLTDFKLNDAKNAVLKQAFAEDAAVITPNPRHHSLYADKRNLILLSDDETLKAWNIPAETRETLSQIPKTILVTLENAEALWELRRQYFFKPKAGFGSRATYRGAKLTKKVWAHILKGGYVAQEFVAPPLRAVTRKTDKVELKFDVRVYTYDGEPLLMAARVYQGQTTNLRTEGGGLAPIVTMDSANLLCC